LKVKLEQIIDALEFMDRYSEYFLDLETGEIEWVSDMTMTYQEKEEIYEKLDEHGFVRLPDSFDLNEYSMMEDFASALSGKERSALLGAIKGKGAFRRFKDRAQDLCLIEEWYEFKEKAIKRAAASWCTDHDIEYEE